MHLNSTIEALKGRWQAYASLKENVPAVNIGT